METSALTTAIETGFTAVSANVSELLLVVLPIGLGIFGIKYGVRFVKGMFKDSTRG